MTADARATNGLSLGRLVPLLRVCKDCGDQFTVDVGEQVYMLNHGLELPKRCPVCRAKNKQRRVRL